MENQPLLSVIVPSYNVEKYIDKCISSIVNQTYINLEILLIDDGSTDNTGKICDEWQERDQRIRVIHKQNEGVAYARKTGVDHAKAEYVTFVDADDWIDVNMYSGMMSALLTTNSDVAHCALCYVYEDGRREELPYYFPDDVAPTQTFGRVEAVLMNLNDKWWPSVVPKIYKKKLFDHIEITKGRIFGEDQLDHLLFHHASQIVFLNSVYYFYFQRSDSISKIGNIQTEMKKVSDVNDLYYERFTFVKQHFEYHSVLPLAEHYAMIFGIYMLRNIIANPRMFPQKYFDVKIEQMRSISLSGDDKLRRKLKAERYALMISPKLYKFLISLYFCMIRMTNRLKISDRKTYYTVSDLLAIVE